MIIRRGEKIMDPDEALRQLREWAAKIEDDACYPDDLRAAELFQGLDQWLCSQGYRPKAWAWAPFPSERVS